MKRNLKKFIGFVLDASGSMDNGRDETIAAYNAQLDVVKSYAKQLDVEFVKLIFNSGNINPEVWSEDISKIPNLDRGAYVPRGGTPLYDSIGAMIDSMEDLEDADHPAASFMVVIFTDGLDNGSRTFSIESVAKKIKSRQEKGNWTFVYIGTEHDISRVAGGLGIPIGNRMRFTKSMAGFRGMAEGAKTAVEAFMRSSAIGSVGIFGNKEFNADEQGQLSLASDRS